jgi:hypothetical protein
MLVSLFGPKLPCTHCGMKVKKPDDPAKFLCPHCQQPGPWATAAQVASWKETQAKRKHADEARAGARTRYGQLLEQIATGAAAGSAVPGLRETVALTEYEQQELALLNMNAWYRYASLAVSDDIITTEEDKHLASLFSILGLTWEQINANHPDIRDRLLIASINGGSLPEVRSPQLIAKKGEVIHLEWPAELMKEVTLREFRAGYWGFSFPIGKTGIRYRVGGARGHSVVLGTQMQVADSGILSISSLRAVFIGTRKTIELPYAKLANLSVYTDGVQFHQSNRQTAPLFRLKNGEVVAAMVNAAAQRLS